MALSAKAKRKLAVAMASEVYADEVATAINVGANPQAAEVAAFGATSNLSALVVTASSISAGSPAATDLTTVVGTYANGAEPTGAEVDASVNALAGFVETALDLKAEQSDMVSMASAVQSALDLKSDNADVETLRSEAESRLDNLESKINAILTALKDADLMAG